MEAYITPQSLETSLILSLALREQVTDLFSQSLLPHQKLSLASAINSHRQASFSTFSTLSEQLTFPLDILSSVS
jgi:hypothetical protein